MTKTDASGQEILCWRGKGRRYHPLEKMSSGGVGGVQEREFEEKGREETELEAAERSTKTTDSTRRNGANGDARRLSRCGLLARRP
jgi:hypothetical protein